MEREKHRRYIALRAIPRLLAGALLGQGSHPALKPSPSFPLLLHTAGKLFQGWHETHGALSRLGCRLLLPFWLHTLLVGSPLLPHSWRSCIRVTWFE